MREELIAGLSRDYGGHAYGKWGGAFWRLISLVDLGVQPGDAAAAKAAEQTLDWVASPRRLAEIHKRSIDGRVRRCASQEGQALRGALAAGLRGDPRVDTLAESLVATQWPDGGWNCDRRPQVTHSSFNETWGPLLGLAAYGADDAVERGAEFILRHGVVFSHRTGEPAHAAFFKLRFPAYWHYDLLAGLRTLEAAGRSAIRGRVAHSISSRRSAATTARGVSRGSGGSVPARRGATSTFVEWDGAANELLTEQATRVLRAAGRALMTERRLLILGEGFSHDSHYGKTMRGIIRYGPDPVVAILDSRRAGESHDGIPVVGRVEDALAYGPTVAVVGVATQGGRFPPAWRELLKSAIANGLDLESGLHEFVSEDPELIELARRHGVALRDLRVRPRA